MNTKTNELATLEAYWAKYITQGHGATVPAKNLTWVHMAFYAGMASMLHHITELTYKDTTKETVDGMEAAAKEMEQFKEWVQEEYGMTLH